MDLPTVQRLRYVKQLSVLDLVFPGATHTRFEHSVGVYYLAQMVGYSIQRSRTECGEQPDELLCQLEALNLAALFHDVGHGPYSHTFEDFQLRHKRYAEMGHEDLTYRLITEGCGIYSDIPRFLQSLAARRAKQFGEAADWILPVNVAAIATMALPPKSEKCTFLGEIIGGDFGVDRLDYLRRDAFHTGLGTGTVDTWEIVHNYKVVDNGVGTVVRLPPSLAQAVEALVSSRDLVFRRAYYTPTHRVAEEMLIAALHAVEEQETPESLALATDDELLNMLISTGGPLAKCLAERVKYRRLYEPLPLEIDPGRHLDIYAQRGLTRIVTDMDEGAFETVWDATRNLANSVGLRPNETVLFSLRPPSLTKAKAYKNPYFYDSSTKESFSLLDLLPHLRLSHGADNSPVRQEDLHALHEKLLTRLLVSVPWDWIGDLVRVAVAEHRLREESEEDAFDQAATLLFESGKFERLLDGLLQLLDARDGEESRLLRSEFRERMTRYLHDQMREFVASR
jgi:HD superfamily phosphohydrolase